MASSLIISWQIEGRTVEICQILFYLISKSLWVVTAAMKLKDTWSLGGKKKKKTTTKLDSILKNKDISLSTKAHIVKAMVFLVVVYGCKSWTLWKTESQRIDVFELWCWRRFFRVPWTAKEINPELEGLMLKLKLQNFGHQMQRADSLEKILRLVTVEGNRRNGGRG